MTGIQIQPPPPDEKIIRIKYLFIKNNTNISNNRSTEQREIYMTLHSKNMGSIKNTKIVQE